ncbi:MAG: heparinase II/III family protein [Rhodospirillaceae bacterium]
MTGSRDSWDWLRDGIEALAFGNPLYNMMLGGRTLSALPVVPQDLWPGDPERGSALLDGVFTFADQTLTLETSPLTDGFWQPEGASDAWYAGLHSFHWLRDLRALGGDEARRTARSLVYGWSCCHAVWHGDSWTPFLAGSRIANWIGLHDFYCASADESFRSCVFDSLARQTRHLRQVMPGDLQGTKLIAAIKGLAFGGLVLPNGLPCFIEARRLLDRELPHQILSDGSHVSRNPSAHLMVLRDLIDIRSALRAAKVELPALLIQAIERMVPVLRFLRHGDGALALFNGGREEEQTLVDTVLTQADSRARPMRSLPEARFERLHGGRALVIFDAGAPPPPGADRRAHAGTLSFEFSIGKERLVVNCGAHPEIGNPWHQALAGTAAHSTVMIGDLDSSEVAPDGGLGRRPSAISGERREAGDEIAVTASHNGYLGPYGLIHRRHLSLDPHGNALSGEDLLEPAPGAAASAPRPFAVRFHLHPSVQARVEAGIDGPTVLMLLPGGAIWRFSAEGAHIDLDDSVYCGTAGPPRPCFQIIASGEAGTGGDSGEAAARVTSVTWAFTREQPSR